MREILNNQPVQTENRSRFDPTIGNPRQARAAEIKEAIMFASGAHAGQTRDFSKQAYIEHPKRVAEILGRHGFQSVDVQQAAILHDTIEDTGVDAEELSIHFSPYVVDFVRCLTEPAKARGDYHNTPREQRKAEYNEQLAVSPPVVQTIKVADILDNTLDFVNYCHLDVKRSRRFLANKRETLDLLRSANKNLIGEAKRALQTLEDKLNE